MTSQELFQTILESDLQISNPTVVFSEVSQSTDTGTLMLEAFENNNSYDAPEGIPADILSISVYTMLPPRATVGTPVSGTVIQGIPCGNYLVLIHASGYVPRVYRLDSLLPGETRNIRVSLWKPATVRIHPVHFPSRTPIIGGTYKLVNADSEHEIVPFIINQQGCAVFEVEHPGTYRISVDTKPDKRGFPYLGEPLHVKKGQTLDHYIWYGNMYDAQCKILFSRPLLLSQVMKLSVAELAKEDLTKISARLVRSNPLSPQSDANNPILKIQPQEVFPPEVGEGISYLFAFNQIPVTGLPNENHTLEEGTVIFDFPFRCEIPNWNGSKKDKLCLFLMEFSSDASAPAKEDIA